ncbi:MAG: TlpA family protein disulfide reductase, partial [Flavobacteriales bacterium]|nr:TlpA family protein disulfide reductase [Flavobacteriales bacterium]
FENHSVSTAIADTTGHFTISFEGVEDGMGFISVKDGKPYFIVLSGQDIVLKGGYFADPNSITCTKGKEQQAFIQYASEHPRREQALTAWEYLERIYQGDSLFADQESTLKSIAAEKARIKAEDQAFIESLPVDSYVRWYLPMRSLVSSVSTIAQYRPKEIPETIAAFRQIDYSDERLSRSGLLKDAIESHYWLLENMGQPLDTVFLEMNKSTDRLLESLEADEEKFNEITDYLFDLLERHSLFQASEYLALKALTQGSCTLNENLAKQLETYRAMKKGNTVPDISFKTDGAELLSKQPHSTISKLSDIATEYKLVVFGASWCPKCSEEIPRINGLYNKWLMAGMDVVFISLDESAHEFKEFASDFDFLSYCDYKKWESPVAEDYYVFSTPTMFLLDTENKIRLRPHSVKQVDAWVDWYLDDDKIDR